MPLPFNKWKPKMLLDLLQCTGQPFMTKNYLPQMSNAELEINTCVDQELGNGQHLPHGPVIQSEFSVCLALCQELYIQLTSLQVEMIEDR